MLIKWRQVPEQPVSASAAGTPLIPASPWQVGVGFIRRRVSRVVARFAHPGVQNAAWIGVEKIGRMTLALLVGVLVVRQLGPERYGTYSYLLAWASMFGPIALFGVGENTVRHLVGSRKSEGSVLGTSALLRSISCAVAALLTLCVFWAVGARVEARLEMLAIPLAALLAYPLLVLEPYFQAHSRARVITMCGLGSGIAAAALKVWGIATGATVSFFLFTNAAESILLGASLLATYLAITPPPRFWRYDKSLAVTLCREALPMVLGGFAIMIYNQSDLLLLGILLDSPHEMGIYSAACRVSTMWMFIPMAVMTSASPFLYRLVDTDAQRYEHRLLQMMTLCVGIAYAFCIALTLFAGPVLTTLFGGDFSASAAPLRVHVWSNVFAILGVAQRSWILSRGLLWISLQNTILGAIVNLGLNIFVIPTYGATGASWTTLASMLAATIIAMAIRPATRPLATIQWKALSLFTILGKPSKVPQDDLPCRSAVAQQAPCERP